MCIVIEKVAKKGPIGVNHLSQEYGGKMRRRSTPGKPVAASRKSAIRVALQQLEDAGYVSRSEKRQLENKLMVNRCFTQVEFTPAGQKVLNEAAFNAKELAVSKHPGLEQY